MFTGGVDTELEFDVSDVGSDNDCSGPVLPAERVDHTVGGTYTFKILLTILKYKANLFNVPIVQISGLMV